MSVVITSDMVGQTFARFSAVECTTGSGRPTREQLNFLRAVTEAGGIAAVVRDDYDINKLLG